MPETDNYVTQYMHAVWMLASSVVDSVICSYSLTQQYSLVLTRWQAATHYIN